MNRVALSFVVGSVILVLSADRSYGIPAFARKYKTSCATCHNGYPKLNAFGDAFRRNGYQFPAGTDPEFGEALTARNGFAALSASDQNALITFLNSIDILTRWDMLGISNKVASLSANQSSSFAAPVEFITLSVSSTGVVSGLPVISDVQVANITPTSATIQWTTDVASDSSVSYGLSVGTDTNVVSVGGNVTSHSVNLTGLQTGTTYFFNVSSTSTGGTTTDDNQGQDYAFVTLSPQSIQTVFVIPMENLNWSSILSNTANAPYINNTLLPMASHAEQYYNPPGLHPSLPNYLWLEAGTNFGITSDLLPSSAHQSTTNHLVTLLKNAGISWRSYDEDINGLLCPLVNTNNYVPRHNPFVYFDDVTCNTNPNCAFCIANDVPYTTLAGDLQNNTVARYNWVVPNLCDDMHNSCAPTNNNTLQGDGWLSRELPNILNSQAYSNNGAIFIVWDEGAGTSDGPIGMIVISPLAKGGGYSNAIHYTHSSTLLTMEEIFNVGPLLGDAANATDLSDLFIFAPQLSVTPASGLTSSGQTGGPFSPGNQVYTLSNTGGVALVWAASKTANWLTLSASGGTLGPGSNTSVTVSINANANSLLAGSYSDTVTITNTSNGAGSTTRAVSLSVTSASASLSVSPATGLSSAGPPGGPFSPSSQPYALTNSGNATLSWAAGNTVNWLTLSATSGTLAPGAGTSVTVSINANANSLTAGSYSDTVLFTNTTNGAGSTSRAVSLNVSAFGFYDDFSTFTSGNLVGQQSWTQLSTISSLPIQVSGGQAVIPGGQTVDNQDAYKNFALTNETVFYGLTLTVTSPPTNASPSYFVALYTLTNPPNPTTSNFANFRLTAKAGNAAKTNYVLAARVTGQTGDPYTFGTTLLTTGTQYRVIVQALVGTNVVVYVNPTSSDINAQAQYLNNPVQSGTPPTSVGAAVISQFGTIGAATGPTVGLSIGKFVVADSFAIVYNDLLSAVPPQLAVSPASRDFGSVPTGQTNSLPFSVINTGGSSLTGTATVSGPFAVTAGGSYTVGAGQTQTVTVSFVPVSGGAFSNAVAFNSNGGNSSNTVTGIGIVPPVASFTASPTSGTEPLGVTFMDFSTGSSPLGLSWNLGDSTTNTAGGASFGHTYAAGTYSVTLTASNAAGTSTLVSNNLITVITALQAWQLQYFNCTNCPQAQPDADPFGKGISNTNQFLVGLNPTNPASLFRIISAVPQGNNVVVTWTTAGAHTNAVQATGGDANGGYSTTFSDLSGPIILPGNGDMTTNYLDNGGATNLPSRYYRIRLVP